MKRSVDEMRLELFDTIAKVRNTMNLSIVLRETEFFARNFEIGRTKEEYQLAMKKVMESYSEQENLPKEERIFYVSGKNFTIDCYRYAAPIFENKVLGEKMMILKEIAQSSYVYQSMNEKEQNLFRLGMIREANNQYIKQKKKD